MRSLPVFLSVILTSKRIHNVLYCTVMGSQYPVSLSLVCSGGGYMRRLADTECPLPLCLLWADAGTDAVNRTRLILQENDTGEIMVSRCPNVLILTQSDVFAFSIFFHSDL